MSAFIDLPPLTKEEKDLQEAKGWSLRWPSMASPSLLALPLPPEMDETDLQRWAAVSPGKEGVYFITAMSSYTEDLYVQSVKASNRYASGLPKLVDRFPQHAPFLLLLAECHFLMGDTHGALDFAKTARDVLLQSFVQDDDILNQAIRMLEILAADAAKELPPDDPTIPVVDYLRPPDWSVNSAPSNLVELFLRWKRLQEMGDGAEQFARLACVETNQLEGVFELEGDSSRKLARCGFLANSIEGISQRSRRRNPNKILSTLKNTELCYSRIKSSTSIDGDTMGFDASFFKELHTQLLDDDNIDIELEEYDGRTYYAAELTPLGTYRKVPCFASHEDYETHFCPADRIEQEMNWFYNHFAMILSDGDLDPYRACAWIQHAFLRIHPFCDGNGRISRLISSIPLLAQGLPPVYVSLKSKQRYFAALKVADGKDGDIDDLAEFLQQETFDAMESLLTYVPSPSGEIAVSGRRRRSSRDQNSPETSAKPEDSSSVAGEEKKVGEAAVCGTPPKMGNKYLRQSS